MLKKVVVWTRRFSDSRAIAKDFWQVAVENLRISSSITINLHVLCLLLLSLLCSQHGCVDPRSSNIVLYRIKTILLSELCSKYKERHAEDGMPIYEGPLVLFV